MQTDPLRRVVLRLVVCAMLTSLGVVLAKVANIPGFVLGAYTFKIGFGTLPVILSGVLYGPLWGGMVGGMTDFLQAILFPAGAYQPLFTVIGVLFGLIPGLFFMRNQFPAWPRLLLAIALGQIIGSVICNTALLVLIYARPWEEILLVRVLNQAVMIPLYTLLITLLVKVLSRYKLIGFIRHGESPVT